MDELIADARAAGVRVEFTYQLPARRAGELRPGVIVINSGHSHVGQRAALAHELGHLALGHVARITVPDEDAADRYAANLLIDQDQYAEAERLVGPHLGALARELQVPVPLVEAWRRGREPRRCYC